MGVKSKFLERHHAICQTSDRNTYIHLNIEDKYHHQRHFIQFMLEINNMKLRIYTRVENYETLYK